jgi:hypothetical protein
MKTTRERLEAEIRDRVQILSDSGGSSIDPKMLRKFALRDLVDKGTDAGGYLGAGGSYKGEELEKLTKEWIAMRNLAKSDLRKIGGKLR